LLDYHQSRGNPTAAVPRAVVLTWQGRLEQRVRERREYQEIHGAAIGSSAAAADAGSPVGALDSV
jgi:hypothetical protein